MLNGAEALHRSVREGKIQKTWRILKKHPELINERAGSGRTPLQIACINKNRTLIGILTRHGAGTCARDRDDPWPRALYLGSSKAFKHLKAAVESNDHQEAKTLSQLGIDPFSRKDKVNLIFTAVQMLSFPLVKALYRSGIPLSQWHNVWGPGVPKNAEKDEISSIFKLLVENKEDSEETKAKKQKIRQYLERYSNKAMRKHVATDDVKSAVAWLGNAPGGIDDIQDDDFIELALIKQATKILCLLIKKYPRILYYRFFGKDENILHWAARHGHLDVIEEALKHPVDCDAFSYMEGKNMTPLMTAAKANQMKVVELLIPRSDINKQSRPCEETALHFAARHGSPEMVQLLLDNGAKLLRNQFRDTPLNLAMKRHRREPEVAKKIILSLMKEDPSSIARGDMPLLHWASKHGHNDIIEEALKYPTTDCDSFCSHRFYPYRESQTPLMRATCANKLKTVELLIPRSDVNLPSGDESRTALHLAVLHGFPEIVQLLLDNGAKQVKDKKGKTPLDLAREKYRKEPGKILKIIQSLIKKDPNCINSGENPLLHWASQQSGYKDVIVEVLQHPEANCNAFSNGGLTPLMYAAGTNTLEAAELLIPRSEVNLPSPPEKKRRTALHFAVLRSGPEMVELLLKNGALQVPDEDGKTPLDLAHERKNIEYGDRLQQIIDVLNEYKAKELMEQLNALEIGKTSCPAFNLRRRASYASHEQEREVSRRRSASL